MLVGMGAAGAISLWMLAFTLSLHVTLACIDVSRALRDLRERDGKC